MVVYCNISLVLDSFNKYGFYVAIAVPVGPETKHSGWRVTLSDWLAPRGLKGSLVLLVSTKQWIKTLWLLLWDVNDNQVNAKRIKLSNMKHQSRLKVLQKLYIINNVIFRPHWFKPFSNWWKYNVNRHLIQNDVKFQGTKNWLRQKISNIISKNIHFKIKSNLTFWQRAALKEISQSNVKKAYFYDKVTGFVVINNKDVIQKIEE